MDAYSFPSCLSSCPCPGLLWDLPHRAGSLPKAMDGPQGSAGTLLCTTTIPMSPTLFQEPCYGEFTKDFISTLNELTKYNEHDHHIQKVYKDMEELTRICPKLQVSCLFLGEQETSFLLPPQLKAHGAKSFLRPPWPHVRPQALLLNPKEVHSRTGAGAQGSGDSGIALGVSVMPSAKPST